MRAHVRDVICGGDDGPYGYVMGWMARCVQKPGKQGEVALVLRGKKGTGKGAFARDFGRLFGQHFIHVTNSKHLVGNFNAHLEDAVVVFADEAFWAGDKRDEGVLKALVTEPTITIEAKHRNARAAKNVTHLIVASNSDWAVPASGAERRYCVLDVSDAHLQDHAYFQALAEPIQGTWRTCFRSSYQALRRPSARCSGNG